MKVLVCIDDTDNLESRGTGDLASELAETVECRGWGSSCFVTRHQLLVHPDVPYTSHNSSMCFEADIASGRLTALVDHASGYLVRESAVGSDPGLCVAVLERLTEPEALIAFGRRAKQEVLTKQQAYDLARRQGVHLSEHGGTGQGVIGALAGVGLRMTGNDGRVKGWLRLRASDGVTSVADILAQTDLAGVRAMTGEVLGPEERVAVAEKPKAVLLDGQTFLMVSPAEDGGLAPWRTTCRRQLKQF
jgi:hypothetical protein